MANSREVRVGDGNIWERLMANLLGDDGRETERSLAG